MAHDFWNPFLTGISIAVILMWLQSLGAKRLTRLEEKLDRLLAALDVPLTTARLTPSATGGQILPPLADMDGIANSEIGIFLRQGKKINAIKVYREQTGLGLKDSKDAVEALEAEMKARGLI